MKKTLIALMAFAGMASAADVGSCTFTGSEEPYVAGTTYGSLSLNANMTTGKDTDIGITFSPTVNINKFNFAAGDYTVSLWVESDSLESNRVLFGYCGSWSSNKQGYNGLTWNATNGTLTLGQGEWKADGKSFAYTDSSVSSNVSSYITEGLTNITLAVSGEEGEMTADLWINGVYVETFESYGGKMNNPPNNDGTGQMKYFVGKNEATYGTISITDEKLTEASQIAALAGATLVPEPTTATLSLLALAGLAARRRRH